MIFTTLALLSLVVSTASAGPHARHSITHTRRRHHARRAGLDTRPDDLSHKVYGERKRDDCDAGAWQCDGDELQRCNDGSWISVQTCSGDHIVCSADSRATGCIWSWSLDDDDSASASATTSATASAVSSAAVSSEPSLIADALYAGDSSTHRSKKRKSSSTQDWYGATSTDEEASTTSSAADWSATSSASSTTGWYGQTSASAVTSTKRGKTSTTSRYASATGFSTASASPSASTSASTTNSSSGGGSSGSFSAPHYVIYADEWLNTMPSASDLADYNRFILAFWMTGSGAVDNAQFWEELDESTRSQTIEEYHNAGIALMVSAFGSTDTPTSSGVDPTSCAQQLAAWVKQYGLDGVDIDYEDMSAMNGGSAEAWLITFQQELRSQLPGYLISHAPVAPWFTSGNSYSNGAYVKVNQEAGSGIDWYNVQFYNQGSSAYTTCETLITDSGSSWPDTSVMGIHSNTGMSLDKIVIGKPLDSGAASNGYMDGSTLNTCVKLAKSQGWNGGVMFWEWNAGIAGSLIASVLSS